LIDSEAPPALPLQEGAPPIPPEPSTLATPAPLARRIASAVSVTGFGSVVTMLLTTLSGVAIARHGGPQGYAVFVAANMLIFVSASFCDCGLSLALAKHVAQQEEEGQHEAVRRLCTTTLGLMLFLTVWVALLVSLNLTRLEGQLLGPGLSLGTTFTLAFPFVLLLTVISYCASGIYYGLLRPRAELGIWISGPLAMLAYVVAYRFMPGLPIWGAAAASYACSGIVAGYQLWRDRLLGTPLPLAEMRPLINEIVPVIGFTFFTVFSTWSDRWIVGAQLGGAVSLGLYAAAVAVIQAALRVPTHIAYVLVPAAAKVSLQGAEKTARFNSQMMRAFGLFAILMMSVIWLAAPALVPLLFGPGFTPAIPALLLMTPSLLACAISYPFMSALTGSTRSYRATLLLALTVPPRLIFLWLFTKYYGLPGTALATALADSLLAVCCIVIARGAGITLPLRALIQPCLIGALSCGVGFTLIYCGTPQLIAIIPAVAIFVPALWRLSHPLRPIDA